MNAMPIRLSVAIALVLCACTAGCGRDEPVGESERTGPIVMGGDRTAGPDGGGGQPGTLVAAARSSNAPWQFMVNANATLAATYEQAAALSADWPSWGANWKYAQMRLVKAESGDGFRRFTGGLDEVQGADGSARVDVEVTARVPAANRIEYRVSAIPQDRLGDIIGLAMELDLSRMRRMFNYEPTITYHYPGDRTYSMVVPANPPRPGIPEEDEELARTPKLGFDWGLPGGDTIEFRFKEPTRLSFMRGETMRVFYMAGDVEARPYVMDMTVTFPDGEGQFVQTLAEKLGPENLESWYEGVMLWDKAPVDLGFLNEKPAGGHGFVTARNGEFVFEDGTPVRFWGGNIAAYALFNDNRENIEAQAKRIAAMGFNLMRLHHHDSMGWVTPTVIDKSRNDSQTMNEEALDKLDYLVKCLKDQGVYIYVDLHVGRLFKAGDDIPGFESDIDPDDRKDDGAGEGKGYCYYSDRIEQLMKEFNERYVTRVNKYTGLSFKDDPAVIGMLVTNENDLTQHFGNLMLGDKGNPYHNKIFVQRATAYAEANGLDPAATMRTWVPGPSKRYLNHEQMLWAGRMQGHLRSIGVRIPVVTSQFWAGMGMKDLPALTVSDFVDVHSYGGRAFPMQTNPRFESNFGIEIVSGQLPGMPHVITEWHTPWPAAWRAVSPMYMSGLASLQSWDAPMLYNYSQRPFDNAPSRPETWTSYYEPGIMAPMPAAALAFRRGDFKPAEKSFLLKLTEEQIYDRGLDVNNTPAVRTLAEQHALAMGVADLPEGYSPDETITDPMEDYLAGAGQSVTSDTGEIMRNWAAGVQAFNSPRTQGAQGLLGFGDNGDLVKLDDVTLDIHTPFAVVIVSSLDGEPIASSSRLLVTACGRASAIGGRLPFYTEPVTGQVRIRTSTTGLTLKPMGGDGAPLDTSPAEYEGGECVIELAPADETHWYILEK